MDYTCAWKSLSSSSSSRRFSSSWRVLPAPKARFCSRSSGVCSHNTCKELSLLSFLSLSDPFRGLLEYAPRARPSTTFLSAEVFQVLCPRSYNQPDLSFLRLVTENSIQPALACTVRITQFTLGKTRTKFNCLASSTHSMRRNSTALYAGISWLKQRNN
jgi:hypothetical protein